VPAHLLTFPIKDAQNLIEIDLLAHNPLGPQGDTVISYVLCLHLRIESLNDTRRRVVKGKRQRVHIVLVTDARVDSKMLGKKLASYLMLYVSGACCDVRTALSGRR